MGQEKHTKNFKLNNMNIHQGLKEKNRITGDLRKLDARVLENGRWPKGSKPSYELKELLEERKMVVVELNALKLKVTKATVPIVDKILEMAELKAYVKTLQSLRVKEGMDRAAYSRTEAIEYDSAMTEKEKDSLIREAENKINELQDELDKFNAVTELQ